jgi:hypothetical protein
MFRQPFLVEPKMTIPRKTFPTKELPVPSIFSSREKSENVLRNTGLPALVAKQQVLKSVRKKFVKQTLDFDSTARVLKESKKRTLMNTMLQAIISSVARYT